MDSMLSQLADVVQARSQVERMIIQLTSDLQAVHGRIDTHASEIVCLTKDLTDRLLKCDQDNRMAVSASVTHCSPVILQFSLCGTCLG